MAQAAIFDIDGTLADLSHRLHHVTGGKKDYEAFFAEVSEDGHRSGGGDDFPATRMRPHKLGVDDR